MAKVINISDKLSNDKPKLEIGDKEYEVNDGMATVIKFEEMASNNSASNIVSAIKLALGEKASKELKVDSMSIQNLKVLTIAIFAAMLDLEYEEAEARFQKIK